MKTVLIVDDESDTIAEIKHFLTRKGHRVVSASNGRDGLNALQPPLPDIIVTDWMMPGMDGIEFCRRLKASELHAAIPVIMITGALSTPPVSGLCDALLKKPVDLDELLITIKKYLRDN